LSHERLVDIADAAAAQQPFENILPPKMSPRRRDALLDAVKAGRAVPTTQHPEIIRHAFHRPSEAEFRRFREIEKRRDARAHELAVDPTLIASKATIGDLSRDWDKHAPELMNWQHELLK
jgi:ribonuclease D